MAARTKCLVLGLAAFVCVLVVSRAGEHEIQDFEFADSDGEVRIVKRAAIDSDDEDFLATEPGSTWEEAELGSGRASVVEGPPPSPTIRSNVAYARTRFYRVSLSLTSLTYIPQYGDRNSRQFEQLATDLKRNIESLFRNIRGQYTVTVLNFSSGSVVVTFDIESDGLASEEEIKRVVDEAIRSGRIGSYTVGTEDFTFRALEAECPRFVGREPEALRRGGLNWAVFQINVVFPCNGFVTAWEYYRTVAEGTAYAAVWRIIGDTEFILVGSTELPPSQIGFTRVVLESPIEVESGDIVGIIYPRSTPSNVIAQATLVDDLLSSDELFQTYQAQVYESEIERDIPLEISSVSNSDVNATYSLRAFVSYEGIASGREVVPFTCSPDMFSCGDGYCIELSYVCDSQKDCNNNRDEQNCPVTEELEPCLEGRFRCNDGTCINRILRCNGKVDCPDGSDERCDQPGQCREGEFTCGNGECISQNLRCDRNIDCMDETDEANCPPFVHLTTFPPTCPDGYFKCKIGGCIEASRKCDYNRDCFDGSDESPEDCTFTCSPAEFTCNSGECVSQRFRCDSVPNCADESDELGCPCQSNQFECADGQCISETQRCDRVSQCRDGSDEVGCPCRDGEFQCGDGQCIPSSRVCDKRTDCRDASDEADCGCRRNEFTCASGDCIDRRNQCDRSIQCPDGSDEFNCTCNAGEFRCSNGQCIPRQNVCNLRPDCYDRSDEFNCPVTCRGDQFSCVNGECIDRRRTCDGKVDCSDLSDEEDCPPISVTISPQQLRREEGSTAIFICRAGSPEDAGRVLNITWVRRDEKALPPQAVIQGERLTIPNLSVDDTGVYVCRVTTVIVEIEATTRLDVEYAATVTAAISPQQLRRTAGTDAIFSCTSDSRNPVSVTWTRISGLALPPQAVVEGGRLTIPNLRVEDAGDYLCRITTSSGAYVDAFARLVVDDVTSVTVVISPQQFRGNAGSTVTFSCTSEGSPPRSVQWFRRSGGALPAQAVRQTDGRLTIPNLRVEDTGDYVCQVLTAVGEFESVARLQVDIVTTVNVVVSPQQIRRNAGSTVTFSCTSEGSPAETVQWYRRSREGLPPQAVGADGRLTISNIRVEDAGEYVCRVTTAVGQFEAVGRLEVDYVTDIYVTISPQQLKKRVGTSASFVCITEGGTASSVQWIRRTGGAMPTQAVVANGRLTIVNLRIEDSGDYLCRVTTLSGVFEANARLEVEYVGPPTRPPGPEGPCSREEATCSDGRCIPRDFICDGEPDCADSSDETNCVKELPCEPNEFRCDNGRCALKIWRCDGDDDCNDNSDEKSCPTRLPGAPCQSDEFVCRDNIQCIPYAFQCDGEIDCKDRSDEIGCSIPSITVPPTPEIIVEVNGTITIICEAVGVPIPLIVWRLNWGNIPVGDRVTVTSINGRGVLIIRNATIEDAGAYTCEAINNKGSIFALPDANIIVRRTIGVCQSPRFKADAARPDECIRCFCFGLTQTCYSSNLQLSQITLGNQVTLVRRNNLEPTEQAFVQYIPSSREFEIRDFNSILRTGSYYWSLPYQYLNKRLSSYGGELSYRVYYEVDGFDVPTSDPDVIISGNGITLYHRSRTGFRPRASTIVTVPLLENAWERTRDSPRGGPISEYATREDLMLVLENVTTILIRATYDNRQSLIRLGNVLLTTGVTQVTGLGRAVNVEECTCPTGYTGFSCEQCAPGFYRVDSGQYGRECVACTCNGHSNDCDALTGVCRNCRDNTAGPYCNECAPGFVGDSRSGGTLTCQPCPCPLTIPSNQFSRTCVLDQTGEIICTACPEGYTGRRCERCTDRYQGNPLVPGDRCIPKSADVCDERGSVSKVPDVVTQQCTCRPNVEGQFCNRCKQDTFHLSSENPYGCISCFCMGVSQTCQSTTWTRAQVSLPFVQTTAGVVLTDMGQRQIISEGIQVDRQSRELVFRGFSSIDPSIRYWSLPQQFLDNKVTAYGGNLRFTLRYRSGRDSTPVDPSNHLVEIGGNDIVLVHRTRTTIPEGQQQSFSVPFIETQWYRMDREPATREHLLMALADLEFILIRATHSRTTEESAISGVSLDIAENRDAGQERAYPVEQCACPRGYKGLSCEDCDTGYTRSGRGLYLGLCEPCQCNGHSSECDPETGVCRNCRHSTQGDHCELCLRGYYGNATRGSITDCQRCPCPLTESPNQFSPDCILSSDGQVTCTACPIGHTGRRCERCAGGYQGNPLQPGDYCKLINVTCDCDERGTVPNTLCDPNTQQCQCKTNVQGRRCSSCLDGYFNLNRNNEMGCLRCFCSGVSTRCSSSTYFRDEIVPMLNSDGTHNFQLTNRRLSRTITDGFTINAERNEISFNNFEGIQREQESLFFSLPPKFRGDKISSYGGYLRFGLSYTISLDSGREYPDVDVEIISKQNKRVYYIHQPGPRPRQSYSYDILLTENSFKNQQDAQTPSREAFLSILANIDAILVRATYNYAMDTVTLRDLRLEIAVPRATGLSRAPEVETCVCPEGYTGSSCQECAAGYLRVEDSGTPLGRCVRCNCNGHATSCDPETGVCQNCQHNTIGERCERCAAGFYGDPTGGTPSDCRTCPCPLTIPSNQFSPTCFLDRDNRVTCDRCPTGYTGRDCGECAPDYQGNPREPGGRCERRTLDQLPVVTVNPTSLSVPLGTTATFNCTPVGRSPFNVVWSRIDVRPLPRRATQGPGPNYSLTIPNVEFADAARYICQVTNAYGTVRESATLNVERLSRPIRVRIAEPTTIVSQPGQTARFVCTAIQYDLSAANYVLSWTKDNGPLPPKSIDQNGVLIIPDLSESDLGTYICTGSDPASLDKATATITFGDVPEAPTVRIEPRYLQVSEGDRVEFRCIAQGNPRPSVRWTRGQNDTLPSYAYTDETGVFRIPSVSVSDQSDYYCTASNSQGTSSVRTIIYVQPRVQIKIIVRRTDVTAQIGQTEQLYCYAEGSGDVVFLWSREGGLPIGATQENGVLTLTNIQPSVAGTYICTGRTPTGIVGTATARITVSAYTYPTVRIDQERQVIGTGTTGTLRCLVTGEPRPVVTWTKSGSPLSSNHQVSGDVLRILQATIEDRGIYICSASNAAGSATASAIIEVERREPPSIELYPNALQTRPTGSSAFFQCQVTGGIPPPSVTWSRAGGRGFTSRTEVNTATGVLRFSSITVEEQGEYTCTATNELGTITETVSLRVEGPPVVTITPGTSITSIVGDRVYIECVALGEPTPAVYWRSDQRRRSDVLPEAFTGQISSASLLFDSIQKSDEGRYICLATNTKGVANETVNIIVQDRESGRQPGIDIIGLERSVIEGQSLELTCTARYIPNPRIRWSRRGNQPLPPNHSVRNGVLFIPRLDPSYAGEYICSVTSDVGLEYSASVEIIVNVQPQITITPSRVTYRPGQPLQLRCQASGPGPFNIEWTKLDGPLSPNAYERDGTLVIRQVTRTDAGRYRCVASGPVTSSEGYADVTIIAPPVVNVGTRTSQIEVGSNLEIRCNAQGDPTPEVTWEKERGRLPPQHQIRNGILTIYSIQPSDSGRYICTATNEAGSASDVTVVVVEETVWNRTEIMQEARHLVGERIELECVAIDSNAAASPTTVVAWTKEGKPLPAHHQISKTTVVIPSLTFEDAGVYECILFNQIYSNRKRIRIIVESQPIFTTQNDYTTAALGNPAQLTCDVQGSPEPEISWTKEKGPLPDFHELVDGRLVIPRVGQEDAGTYNCLAKNQFGTTMMPVVLVVTAFVPYFQQNPVSYLTYEPLTDAYTDMDIQLSFRPEATDGLLLYNGQYKDQASGDFVCFGLQGQYPEFRFDAGSGAATIRGAQPLELNKWHTVHLKRTKRNGTLMVNDEPPYFGEAPGTFEGLDLVEPLYLGNVPDTSIIPQGAKFSSGFVGSVSEVKVKGVDLLEVTPQKTVNVQQYHVCQDAPCLNRGVCRPHNSREGFVCECARGFSGRRCQLVGEKCYQGACGSQGRCYDLQPLGGFTCICPFGLSGIGCLDIVRVADPAFNKTSFISFPTIRDGLLSVQIKLLFKPRSLDDGIILYNSQRQDGRQDFIAILIKDRHLEFRFDTGSGPAILKSHRPLTLNEWTTVFVDRTGKEGRLTVNDDEVVLDQVEFSDLFVFSRLDRGDVAKGNTTGDRTIGLNLARNLYLGGVDPYETINPKVGTYTGFVGCVGELVIKDRQVNLLRDAIESLNVQDCGDRRLCERNPCRNKAACRDLSSTQYTCICLPGYTGANCETVVDICVTQQPCQHDGQCVVDRNGFKCNCPLPWSGDYCEDREQLGSSAHVRDSGYVEFSKDLWPRRQRNAIEVISVTITTSQPNGLIFWQGQTPGNQKDKDYLALSVKDGYVEFSYELGSGPAVIRSVEPVDDGLPHLVVAERLGVDGNLTVDNRGPVRGVSRGSLKVVNVAGNIYFGGVPDFTKYTADLFNTNFRGCLTDIRLQNGRVLSFDSDAVSGMNVSPCLEAK